MSTTEIILATKLDIEKLLAEVKVIKWMTLLVITGILALILKTFFTH